MPATERAPRFSLPRLLLLAVLPALLLLAPSLPARAQTSASPLSCTTTAAAIGNYFNTASDGSGGVLASGADSHWRVINPGVTNVALRPPTDSTLNWINAAVVSARNAAWRPNASNAGWISETASGASNPATGYFYYQIQFYLDPAVDPATFELSMGFWSDNSVNEVWINGLAQSTVPVLPGVPPVGTLPQTGNNFTTAAPETFYTFSQGWQPGLNTITVNVYSVGSPVGLLAAFNAVPRCVTLPPEVSITKTANTTAALAGRQSVTYTIEVVNTGAAAASGVTVADSFPAGIASASWTCTDSSGTLAYCPEADSGGLLTPSATLLDQTIDNLPAGATVTYTITATTVASPPAAIINIATANVSGGVCTDAAGVATGDPMPCPARASNPSLPILSISKTAGTTAALAPGGQIIYTITASNVGAVADSNVQVTDTLPAGIVRASWTCAGSGGAACPATGTGGLSETIASLPAGASVTYTVTATLDTTGLPPTISNTASVNSATGVCQDGHVMPCPSDTVRNAIGARLSGADAAAPVPALDARALAALLLLLGAIAAGGARRARRKSQPVD